MQEAVEIAWLDGALVLVDGRNVQRSRWPNVADDQLVDAVQEWLPNSQFDSALIVFDGHIGTAAERPSGAVRTLATGRTIADDALADLVNSRLEEAPELCTQLVTSDRGLRSRVPAGALLCGGGKFLSLLGLR